MSLFEHRYENPAWRGYTKFLPEVIAVKVGVKPVMRIPVNDGFGYPRFRELCATMGVLTGLSNHKVKEPYRKEDVLPAASTEGDRFMYVALSQELIDDAKRYDLVDEQRFGRLMGYPDCCVRYYEEVMRTPRDHEVYNYVRSGKRLDWRNNYLLRFNSHYYLHAYFVCSFDCGRSAENGSKVLSGIREFDPLFAEKIEHHLKLPILFDDSRPGGIIYNWNRLKGVVFDGELHGDTATFHNQFALWQGSHFPLFNEADMIRVMKDNITLEKDGKNKVTIAKPYDRNGFLFSFSDAHG